MEYHKTSNIIAIGIIVSNVKNMADRQILEHNRHGHIMTFKCIIFNSTFICIGISDNSILEVASSYSDGMWYMTTIRAHNVCSLLCSFKLL